jgi:hypothetical protein
LGEFRNSINFVVDRNHSCIIGIVIVVVKDTTNFSRIAVAATGPSTTRTGLGRIAKGSLSWWGKTIGITPGIGALNINHHIATALANSNHETVAAANIPFEAAQNTPAAIATAGLQI